MKAIARLSIRHLGFVLAVGFAAAFSAPSVHAARTHVVQSGETLSGIAAHYGVTITDLMRANRLSNASLVKRGQKLVIPDNAGAGWTGTHVVASGESLSTIAAAYGVTAAELAQANHLRDADFVKVGQKLTVPGAAGSASATAATVPAPNSAESAPAPVATHTVRRGESLSTIAARYGVTVHDLARANNLRDADLIQRGQKLVIPQGAPAFIEHRVARGESLAVIAERYKVAIADIRAANTLRDPNRIEAGQVLRIPASDTAVVETETAAPAAPPGEAISITSDPRRRLPAAIRAAISSARVQPGRWRHIVIHHSGTSVGSGTAMDRYHREERHMENGLAYHFVIGNGNGMTDGSIFVGRRWNEQLDGGHVASLDLNKISLGICLVGDFEKRAPSRRQMESLEALVRALMKRTGLAHEAVTTHRLIHPKHTLCPGRHFPTEHFRQQLRVP